MDGDVIKSSISPPKEEAPAAPPSMPSRARGAADDPQKNFPPCLQCKEQKPPTCYYGWGTPKWRNFYVCKPCVKLRTVELRRADPAARMHNRLSKTCRQKNVPLKLSRKEIRGLLASVTDRALIDEDRLALRPLRAGEPVTVGNIELVVQDKKSCKNRTNAD